MSDTALVEADPVSTELQTIRDLRRSDPDAYNADKAVQGRELELLEAQQSRRNPETGQFTSRSETGTAVAVLPNADRLAEIRKFAREHPDDYSRDKKMQAEQTALIEAGLGTGGTALSAHAAAIEKLSDAGALVAWDNGSGAEGAAKSVDATEKTLLANLPADDRDAFLGSYANLSDATRLAIIAEAARGAERMPIRSVSAAEFEAFSTSDEGAPVVARWGRDGAYNYAVVRARLSRIIDYVPASELAAGVDWYENLPAAQRSAIIIALAPKTGVPRNQVVQEIVRPGAPRPAPRQETAPRAVAETRRAPAAAPKRFKVIRDRDGRIDEIEVIS